MASEIELKYLGVPSVNQTLTLAPNINMRFVTERSRYGEVSIGSGAFAILPAQFGYFYNAFRIDFNAKGAGPFTITQGNPIIIQHPNDNFFNSATTNSPQIELTVRNIPKPKPIAFTTKYLETATEKNDFVDIEINPIQVVDTIRLIQGSVVIGSAQNTDTFRGRVRRDRDIKVNIRHDGVNNERSLKTPPSFIVSDVFVEGSKATIIPSVRSDQLLLRYAIGAETPDDSEFQASNIFTGLTPSAKTANVKDQYGSLRKRFFTVVETNETDINFVPPYFEVPAINSFRFVDRTRGSNVNANQFEFLSSEIPNAYNSGFYHPVPPNRKYKIQFRSSLSYNFASAISCNTDNLVQELYFERKSNFINQTLTLEGNVIYSSSQNRNLIYFSPGNVYNDLDEIIDTHDYDKTLPLEYEKGVFVFIDGIGQAVITDTYIQDGVEYAMLNTNQNITLNNVKIKSVIKLYDYDVYEAEVDIEQLGLTDFYIRLGGTDNVLWVSERIKVIENLVSLNYHKILYGSDKNNENNDIHYQWGIIHERYVPFQKYLDPVPFAEIESLVSDDRIDKKDYRSKRVYTLLTGLMPKMIADGLAEALNVSTYINVDGKQYVNEEAAELNIINDMATVSVNLTLARKTLSYRMDESLFNQDDLYPVILV